MADGRSVAERLAALPEAEREAWLAQFTSEEQARLNWQWEGFWARPKQEEPPGGWTTWFILAGRGNGKTRTGAEWAIKQAAARPGTRGYLVAETPAEARDAMLEGESGILTVSPPWFKPVYNPSKLLVTWPNGTTALVRSAFNYEAIRGPQAHWAWADELAKWRHMREAWDNLQFSVRLPPHVKYCVTTTPRPLPLIKELLSDEDTVVTKGTTYENVQNLAANFKKKLLKKYEGTRLGRQELHADVLEDLQGALWTHPMLDALRVPPPPRHELRRVIVAVDPSGSDEQDEGNAGHEQGIAAAGIDHGEQGFLLEDATVQLSPAGWGARAVDLAVKWQADAIAYETNFGGKMARFVLETACKDKGVSFRIIEVHASTGKAQRAEPVSALYEQKRIRHAGSFPELEDELCLFTPQGYQGGTSPNRADAAVWAFTELMLSGAAPSFDGMEIKGTWGRRR